MNVKMRANAFAAFGALSNFGGGAQQEAFLEQVVHWFIFFFFIWVLDLEVHDRKLSHK